MGEDRRNPAAGKERVFHRQASFRPMHSTPQHERQRELAKEGQRRQRANNELRQLEGEAKRRNRVASTKVASTKSNLAAKPTFWCISQSNVGILKKYGNFPLGRLHHHTECLQRVCSVHLFVCAQLRWSSFLREWKDTEFFFFLMSVGDLAT